VPFLLLSACASQQPVKAARSLPATPDPAGAKKLSGDWVFAMKVGDRDVDGKLHFTDDGGAVAGSFTATGGESIDLADIRVSKDEFAWTIPGDRGTEVLTGAFASDGTLSGKMTFVRKHSSGEPSGGGSEGEGGAGGESPGSGYGGGGGGHHGHHGARGSGNRSGGSRTATWTAVPAPKDSEPDSPKPSDAARRGVASDLPRA
jgi:hypothetical protein